jgi:hypothetical protein
MEQRVAVAQNRVAAAQSRSARHHLYAGIAAIATAVLVAAATVVVALNS